MSSQPFFVTGFPLTGIAWLSAFLTTERAMCYHEPMGRISTLEQLGESFKSDFYSHIGIADAGAGFFIDWIMENVGPRTVILDRPDREIEENLMRMGFPHTNYLDILRERLVRWRNDPRVLWVPWQVLRNKRVAERVFWHCLPGVAFDETRYSEFVRYKIEIDPIINMQIAVQRKAIFSTLLEEIRPLFKVKEPTHAPASSVQ